ncbi:MAG TPA: hypothetical protein VFZ48_05415 [Candidatus Saccharimonadales bacterium]
MDTDKGILWLRLDEPSRARLLQACPPRHATTYCHHVTLRHGVTAQEYEALFGRQCTVEVYEACWDGSVQAVRVNTHGLPDQYGVPHVTISAADGIAPFTSVAMLKDPAHHHQKLSLELSGVIEFVAF